MKNAVFNINRFLIFSSPLVPAYLSRGPPVLQHPERVVPLSECERFEPHYQPNVALAPIVTPTVPLIPAAPVQHHRRYLHERRRHNHRSPSPNEKPETFPVSVKLEKPSSPVPSAGFVPLAPPSTDETQEEAHSGVCHEDKVLGHHEEEESTAVTSSTVNVESSITDVVTSSPEVDLNSDGSTTAIELNERLVGIDLPTDIVELIKRLSSENAILRQSRISDAREIARLRNLLQLKELQATCKIENNEEVTNASAADSTESNEKPNDSLTLSENKTPEPDVSNENND